MVQINNMWRFSIICLLVLAGGSCAWAQNVVFTAGASAEKVGQQDQVQVTYTIQNAQDLQSLTPVGIDKDFSVLGGPFQSQGSQVYYSNGKMTQTTSLSVTYVVQPKKTGNLTIPAGVAKDAQGRTYQSNAVTIQVVAGSITSNNRRQQQADPFGDAWDDPFAALRQMQQRRAQALRQQQGRQQGQPQQAEAQPADVNIDKDLFIRVTVDKNKVHVGEQITTSYKLYARIPMNVSISKLPSLNGFWTQDFDIPKTNIKPTEEIIDGKKYQVFLLKKSALFPQQTGNLELDPAEAEGMARIVQQVRQRNPFGGFFDDDPFASLMMSDPLFNDDFFNTVSYKDVKVHLKSSPVKINVTPLPEDGKPANFGGAVGSNFTMSGKLDKTSVTTDDVLTYKLTISGSGNLKLFEAPIMSLPNGLSVFDPQISDTITGRTTTISGTKTITYTITPKTAGDYTIPAMSFSYFNPQTGKYVNLSTEPVKVNVKQGKNTGGNNRSIATLTDIHPVYNQPLDELTFNSRPVLYSVGYWSLYAIPLLAFAGVAMWKRREDELSKDTVLLRSKRANKIALRRLALAQKFLQQNSRKPFYEEVSKATWLYLSDKLNIPLASLSREKAQEALDARNISPDMLKKVEQVINECETALYAPSGGLQQMNYTYQQAVDIISKLEESFNA